MNYNYYSEDAFEAEIEKKPSTGALFAIIGSIPGSIAWVILAYYTPFASLTALFITLGAMLGFKLGGKYMTYKTKTKIVIYCSCLIFTLTSAVIAFTLYKQYNTDVLNQTTIDELRESFITNLKNNGKSADETDKMLQNEYGINGINDIEGLNNIVKNTLAETYKDSHRVATVPDTPTNSVMCLYQSLMYNRTIAKPFFFNIIGGITICFLTASGLLRTNYFKPDKI